MIRRVRLSDVRILAGCLPVKLTGLNDDTAECCTVAAEELSCRMNYNVSAVLERSDQVRCTECVIYYYRKSVLVCDGGNSVDIRDITVRVSECLEVDSACVFLDGTLYFCEVMCVYECGFNSVLGQRVCEKVEGTAVDRLLCYDVAAVSCESLDRISDGCCAGCYCECCGTAFQSCYSFLENALCGVRKSSVNVTAGSQVKSCFCVLTVMEDIRCCLIDRHRSCIRCGIGLFLSYVKL